MDVETAEAGGIEDRLRQDQAVGHHHGDIGAETGEGGLFGGGFEADRVAQRQAQRLGAALHRRGPVVPAAARRARRLAIDGDNLVRSGNRIERRDGEIGRAHENDLHARFLSLPALATSILRRIGLRWSTNILPLRWSI